MSSDTPLMDTYARAPVTFAGGRGCLLYDDAGAEYLDCLGGLAVVSAGHSHDRVTAAIAEQAATLVHTSNIYWTRPMQDLACRLHEVTGWGKVFFSNSGAEANECAIKLARKWAGPGRYKVVCAEGAFHGRTLATLAATGQPAKWAGFEPLPEGFVHAPFNDIDAFASLVDAETAAIMVEPIQGENGVIPAERDFLTGLRSLADDADVLLVFDEVQTGVGRTGRFWAHQHYGVVPDVVTVAKALANGIPIGATIASESAAVFAPGDHGSTFGGGPVACAAALATLEVLVDGGYVDDVARKSALLTAKLAGLPHVREVRGVGLLLAAVLDVPEAAAVTTAALANGLVVNPVAPDAVRFAPPLVIGDEQIADAAQLFALAIDEVIT
ncbi:MAG: aspartate aminotransferase family protein [Acidimicrobiia bacterium]